MGASDQPRDLSGKALTGKALTGKGLADQIERRMKAASLLGGAQLREAMMDLGRLVYVESTPIITALRSAGTEGGETQGAVELAHKDRLLALRTRQNTQASQLWAKAAEQALAGDPRALHDRLQLHRDSAATAARIVQSDAALHTRTTDGGEA